MFKILFHILLLASFNQGIAQVHHQMISSQGSTSETSTGYVVTQTIGQTSVVGNYTNTSVKINQGYQQPFWGGLELSNVPDFTASIFPNPSENIISIRHNSKLDIEFFLFNVAGKLVYKNTLIVSSPQQTIDLESISSGVYLVKLKSKQLNYFTKIIKQ